jgi:hypothetical protein
MEMLSLDIPACYHKLSHRVKSFVLLLFRQGPATILKPGVKNTVVESKFYNRGYLIKKIFGAALCRIALDQTLQSNN